MLRHKALLILVAAAIVGVFWIQQAVSQQEAEQQETEQATRPERPPRGYRSRFSPEEMRKRMEQWRQRASERLRETLGASEEEWKVLQPKIEKVQDISRQLRTGAMRGLFGGRRGERMRRGRRPGDDAAPDRPQTDLQKKTEALGKLLENKESKSEDIKAALKDLREARAKLSEDLTKARKELREIVTVRQEAHLVLMGVLD